MLSFPMNKFHLKPGGSDRHVTLCADQIEGTVCVKSMWKEPTGRIGHLTPLSVQSIYGI